MSSNNSEDGYHYSPNNRSSQTYPQPWLSEPRLNLSSSGELLTPTNNNNQLYTSNSRSNLPGRLQYRESEGDSSNPNAVLQFEAESYKIPDFVSQFEDDVFALINKRYAGKSNTDNQEIYRQLESKDHIKNTSKSNNDKQQQTQMSAIDDIIAKLKQQIKLTENRLETAYSLRKSNNSKNSKSQGEPPMELSAFIVQLEEQDAALQNTPKMRENRTNTSKESDEQVQVGLENRYEQSTTSTLCHGLKCQNYPSKNVQKTCVKPNHQPMNESLLASDIDSNYLHTKEPFHRSINNINTQPESVLSKNSGNLYSAPSFKEWRRLPENQNNCTQQGTILPLINELQETSIMEVSAVNTNEKTHNINNISRWNERRLGIIRKYLEEVKQMEYNLAMHSNTPHNKIVLNNDSQNIRPYSPPDMLQSTSVEINREEAQSNKLHTFEDSEVSCKCTQVYQNAFPVIKKCNAPTLKCVGKDTFNNKSVQTNCDLPKTLVAERRYQQGITQALDYEIADNRLFDNKLVQTQVGCESIQDIKKIYTHHGTSQKSKLDVAYQLQTNIEQNNSQSVSYTFYEHQLCAKEQVKRNNSIPKNKINKTLRRNYTNLSTQTDISSNDIQKCERQFQQYDKVHECSFDVSYYIWSTEQKNKGRTAIQEGYNISATTPTFNLCGLNESQQASTRPKNLTYMPTEERINRCDKKFRYLPSLVNASRELRRSDECSLASEEYFTCKETLSNSSFNASDGNDEQNNMQNFIHSTCQTVNQGNIIENDTTTLRSGRMVNSRLRERPNNRQLTIPYLSNLSSTSGGNTDKTNRHNFKSSTRQTVTHHNIIENDTTTLCSGKLHNNKLQKGPNEKHLSALLQFLEMFSKKH